MGIFRRRRIHLVDHLGRKTSSSRLDERWANAVGGHPFITLLLTFLVTVLVLVYALGHFRISTEMSEMISEKLPYRKLEKEFDRAFPQFGNTMLVVVDAETPEIARRETEKIAERLRKETDLFKRVYMPGGDMFFRRNGLLYLSVKELEDLSDNLASAQPLFGFISNDFSLRGLFSVLETLFSKGDLEQKAKLTPFMDRFAKALETVAMGQPYQLSWQELVLRGRKDSEMRRQFIILEPVLGDSTFPNEETAIQTVYRVRDELGLQGAEGVKVRLTGDAVLDYENLDTVKRGMGITTLASFLLVVIALAIGFGSGRLVMASLLTLVVGLIWTLGFAIAAVGYLNLISVTFAVLFIGLSIDYGIQFCLHYREGVAFGLGHHEALRRTSRDVGTSLRLCTVAAAIGFYSFLPTAYVGVSQLGLIAGTGMLINLFATLTVLPALLTFMPLKEGHLRGLKQGRILYRIPYRYAKEIRIVAIVIGIITIFFVPRLSFDYNPLDLYNPRSEAVSTIKDLFRGEMSAPWTLSVLTGSASEAQEVAARLKSLKEVRETITLADYVPDDQSKKLAIISDIALFMPPEFGTVKPEKLTLDEKMTSLKGFEAALQRNLSSSQEMPPEYRDSLRRLSVAVKAFKKYLDGSGEQRKGLDRLEEGLLSNLPSLLNELKASLGAHELTETDLPADLRNQYKSSDGIHRVEVFPKENLMDIKALNRFVDGVTAVTPDAIGTPVIIREAGKAVFQSFIQATLYALIAITIYMLIEFRSLYETALILLPLTLSLLMMGAASVILHIPFNFANVIVIPLLIGSGVEGVYLIYRFRKEPPVDGNMLNTSTARALFFSALTTILSFSTLSFSSHRGMASMGILLTICMGSLMVTTLVLLPVLLARKSGNKSP